MKRSLAVVLAALAGCAHPAVQPARPVTHAQPIPARPPARPSAEPVGDPAALESIRARLAAGDPAALAMLEIHLGVARGARDITGDAATDERVRSASIVARDGSRAGLLVETDCGNVALGQLRWDGAAWVRGSNVGLVSGMRPGRCARTQVHSEALAITSDAVRDMIIVAVSEDATGASQTGPFLSVFELGPEGALVPLLRDAPFGGMDDVTGTTSVGEYTVIPDVPAPRDLHVSIRPGPGAGAEVLHRRYAIRRGHLEMVQQTTETLE